MNFYGLKKVTLIDYPGKIACTVFTHGCTLRCPFCHNPELVIGSKEKLNSISDVELLKFLKTRDQKLDGIVFTGGEPLLHFDKLLPLLEKIKKAGLLIKIDTNGTFPEEIGTLLQKKLVNFIAMDLKIDLDSYAHMGATPELVQKISDSYELIIGGSVPHEIRTTCVPGIHTEETLRAMGPLISKSETYVLQNFIPNGTIDPSFKKTKPFSSTSMQSFLAIAQSFNKNSGLRDQHNP